MYQENNDGGFVCKGLDTFESNMMALDRQNQGNWTSAAKQVRTSVPTLWMKANSLVRKAVFLKIRSEKKEIYVPIENFLIINSSIII